MNKEVRVRFAPSPTGGLHIGGMRTVLFNYLFAKKHQGKFILRIEDTDQNRLVEGAENYILDCLEWSGLKPDEGPFTGGPFAPYRQSERKDAYKKYADQLVKSGHAYYAFDTTEELEGMRNRFKTDLNPTPQYNQEIRQKMRNSLTLEPDEVTRLLAERTPYVVRIRVPADETVKFTDMIRGEVAFSTSLVDDKVLLKADGMPTYHLAVVVDDYLMNITHAFRGEEWLPSAPVHILLWNYLGWQDHMPQWAHLPLILKPDGHGKLSKRDGQRLGFPVFAMNWTDPKTGELTEGYKEKGFLPEAFINMLALLGWNDGTEQEIFSLGELVDKFTIERVHKGGARFDYEKARWFNHEWIKKAHPDALLPAVKRVLSQGGIGVDDDAMLVKVIELVKDRCTLLTDFQAQASFFFHAPESIDIDAVRPKWDDSKKAFFTACSARLSQLKGWTPEALESGFKSLVAEKQMKAGELMLPLRIMLVGGKFGPGVFEIAGLIGQAETCRRIDAFVNRMDQEAA